MTVEYDYMQGSVGAQIDGLITNRGATQAFEAGDTVKFRWWYESDPAVAKEEDAAIIDMASGLVRYTTKAGDLDKSGNMLGQWVVSIAALSFQGPTTPVRYLIGPQIG